MPVETTAHPARVTVAGIAFDPIGQDPAADAIVSAFRAGRGGRAVFVNVDVARQLARRPELARLVSVADLVLADGMPIVWAGRLARSPVPERVAGSTVLGLVAARAAGVGVPVMLLGCRPGSAGSAAAALVQAHPGLVVAWHAPPFGFEEDPVARRGIEAALERTGRCICFVGLGFPKQERLMADLAAARPDWWFVASGGGIDFLADGDRAPEWMQRSGLEWLHRLAREPRRLARRYLVDGLPFAARMLAASAWSGRTGRS